MKRIGLGFVLALLTASVALGQARPPAQRTGPITIFGPGSTGDVSAMSILPKLGNLQRRLDEKLGELPMSAEDFRGGSCGGANDDTCAIKATVAAACAAGTAEVRLFKPGYKISDMIELPAGCNSVHLHGISAQGTVITSVALNKPIIRMSGIGNRVSDVQLAYQGTPVDGATALDVVNASNPVADNFITYNTAVGVKISGGSGMFLNNYQLFNHNAAGIWADNTVDVFSNNVIINAGNNTNAGAGNVRLTNKVEAFVMVGADILLGKYTLLTDATNNAPASRPAYNKFIGTFFDSGFSGSILNNTVLTDFVGCWFSGGRGDGNADTTAPGLTLNNTNAISFTGGTQFFNNGSHGLLINSTARRTVVDGAHMHSNSVTAGSGAGNGITVNGAKDFIITNTTSGNDLYPGGAQGYGIFVFGAADQYSITNNLTQGNQAAGVLDQGTGTNKLLQGNW